MKLLDEFDKIFQGVPSLEIADRIDALTVDVNFVVDVRTCAETRAAHVSDKLSAFDLLPRADDDLGGVPVARHDSVAVVNVDHVAVAARIPARVFDNTVGSCNNRRAHIVCNIHAGMKICAAATQTVW